MMMKHNLRALSVAATAALLIGCGNAATPTALNPSGNHQLTMLSGEDAVEDGQLRVKVVDKTGATTAGGGYKLKALPTTWTTANLRLVSNGSFATATAASANRLTGDRTVALPFSAFTAFATNTAYATDASAANALFTKLRPGQYMFQISLDNSGASTAVQTIKVDITGGAITNLVVTLQTTAKGTASVTIASTGTETLNGASATLKNSTAHANADFAFVKGDTVSLASPVQSSDNKANTQTTTPNGGGTPSNGTAIFASGQMSRIVASLRSGSSTTVSTNVPQADEKIVAVWYDTGVEAKTNTAWSTFYGSAADSAGIVPAISTTSATVTSGLTSASSFTVPAAGAAASGPNGAGIPGITLKTTELGTSADVNAVLIFRYYDNTFEHRYITADTRSVVVDDDASIRVTVN